MHYALLHGAHCMRKEKKKRMERGMYAKGRDRNKTNTLSG
jgi:hypothetical protein